MDKTFLFVDGNSLLYRAFFALPPLSHNGIPLNAIHGFFTMLLKAIAEKKPNAVYVMFDESSPTFRHEEYEAYKAGRAETPDDLKMQFTLIRDFLKACNIPTISKPGFEADDLLGSAARKVGENGMRSIILTGDRDCLQLASENCQILITKKGISESLLLDPDGVKENYGVTPEQVTDLKGLMGDSSDNIPGIPGVGEKTALKLLNEYGTLENTLENSDKIKGKLGEKIRANKEVAEFSKKLATIVTNAPIEIDFDISNIESMADGLPMFAEYKLNRVSSQMKNLFDAIGSSYTDVPLDEIDQIASAPKNNAWDIVDKKYLREIYKLPETIPTQFKEKSIDTIDKLKSTNITGEIFSIYANQDISVYSDKGELINISVRKDLISGDIDFDEALRIIISKIKDKRIIVHDQKAFRYLCNAAKANLDADVVWDTMIANYLIDSESGKAELNSLISNADAKGLYELAIEQCKVIDKANMLKLLSLMEIPLSNVLYNMEQEGFLLDRSVLFELSSSFKKEITDLENKIYESTGFSGFNINSPKQLSEILFDRMNLPHGKKSKSGYSTSADVLEKIADKHPAIDMILEYRKFTKLNSTYIDALIERTAMSERVHSSFDQTGTVTGRISSQEPNLQNIPIRSKEGAEIRKAFVAREGYTLIDADYSQIELRVLTHLSRDKNMINAFKSGKDIHRATAAEIFDTPIEKVDSTMRSNAKAVNFGLVYGISSFGLARNTNISIKQAEGFISKYFERYPGVRAYMDNCVEIAKKDEAIYTLFNRRRSLPQIHSKNANIRAFGERIAMNTPVQGTAADIIKLAMIAVFEALKKYNGAKLILQVHDELIVECKEDIAPEVTTMIKNIMEGIVKLEVPLLVDINAAKSWYESK